MSLLVVFLFLVDVFCFRCWGYKNSRGARWAGSFCSPLCELATLALPDPYFSRNTYIQVRSGIFAGFLSCYGLVAGGFLFSVSWPSGCFLVGWGLAFLPRAISRCFFFCVFFSAFRLLAAVLLHLASSLLR